MFPDLWLGVLGAIVFLLTLVVYVRTVAPTVSFWDCGEFISCSYILGIPHPPGTPLYVLIGRLFSILPISSDIAVRVNLISSIFSAAAATVAFFILARLITYWYSDRYPDPALTWTQRLPVYAGSVCGALFFAFGTTYWSSAVEAEVYGAAMFLTMVLIWLTLVWAYHREEPGSDRYLILISYLAILSVGIHMTVFLVMPPIFLLIVFLSREHRRDWRFWVTGAFLFLVSGGILDFLWACTIWLVLSGVIVFFRKPTMLATIWTVVTLAAGVLLTLSQGAPWPLFLAAGVWAAGMIVYLREHTAWVRTLLLALAALLGFSVHFYIPIRAQLNPAINENAPKTWDAFQGFLERKQYGNESMFQRALHRRGTWANQFGQHERMGFWGFFDKQYGYNDLAFFPLFILGLLGLYQLIRKKGAFGFFLILLLLISSVGLIWYMNFADGTRYNAATQDAYLEVRDRDYFFTPAFIFFGMAIGLGGAALIRRLSGGSVIWSAAGAALIALMPLRALTTNYFPNDRSNNYIPYDYAYNILTSADSNAVVFTNGDNDTFPVWCLQEVYGIRKDVRIANLSLINTHWYIKQLKNQMGVPMKMSDDEIERLYHYRTPEGKLVRVQDQMINEILTANQWKTPIDFAVTVSGSNRIYMDKPLDRHLMMTGLAYRLVREEGDGLLDVDVTRDLFLDVFRYRGINDPTVYKDENATRLVANYASGFILLADTLRRAGRMAEAEASVRKATEILPDEPEAYVYLAQLYAETKDRTKLEALRESVRKTSADQNQVGVNIAFSFSRLGDTARATSILDEILTRNPHYEPAYKTLVRLYYEGSHYDTLMQLLERWMKDNPGDHQTKEFWGKIRAAAAQQESAGVRVKP